MSDPRIVPVDPGRAVPVYPGRAAPQPTTVITMLEKSPFGVSASSVEMPGDRVTVCNLEILDTRSHRGLIAIAKTDIAHGSTILQELPLAIFNTTVNPATAQQDLAGIFEHTAKACPNILKQLRTLSSQKRRLNDTSIFHTNALAIGMDAYGRDIHAVYLSVARCNHSCNPSAGILFDHEQNHRLNLIAATDILAGGEITISYIDQRAWPSTEQRRESLIRRYGFTCTCKICTGSASETSDAQRASLRNTSTLLRENLLRPAPTEKKLDDILCRISSNLRELVEGEVCVERWDWRMDMAPLLDSRLYETYKLCSEIDARSLRAAVRARAWTLKRRLLTDDVLPRLRAMLPAPVLPGQVAMDGQLDSLTRKFDKEMNMGLEAPFESSYDQ